MTEDVTFECNTGSINTTYYEPHLGIIAQNSPQNSYCMTTAPGYEDQCGSIFDYEGLKQLIIEKCEGYENCTIDNPK